MLLYRFQQIHAVIHFNDNSNAEQSKDALFKVCPIVNVLKLTFPAFLTIGDELALDEASIASRSSYGGHVIFFNKTKPGGKYHFRLYLLCDSDTFACIEFWVHTCNMTDVGDGYQEPAPTVQKHRGQKKKKPAGLKTTGITDETMNSTEDGPFGTDVQEVQQVEAEEVDAVAVVVVEEEEKGEGEGEGEKKETKEEISKIELLVLDMCRPLFQTQ